MAKKYISKYTGPEIDSGLDNIPKLEGKLTELESNQGNIQFVGDGGNFVRQYFYLKPGRKYRLMIINPMWAYTSEFTNYKKLVLSRIDKDSVDDTSIYIVNVYEDETVKDAYEFVAEESKYNNRYAVAIRADVGETVYVSLDDITDVVALNNQTNMAIFSNNLVKVSENEVQLVSVTVRDINGVSRSVLVNAGDPMDFVFGSDTGNYLVLTSKDAVVLKSSADIVTSDIILLYYYINGEKFSGGALYSLLKDYNDNRVVIGTSSVRFEDPILYLQSVAITVDGVRTSIYADPINNSEVAYNLSHYPVIVINKDNVIETRGSLASVTRGDIILVAYTISKKQLIGGELLDNIVYSLSNGRGEVNYDAEDSRNVHIALMNKYAERFGVQNSTFIMPNGGSYVTARDMVKILLAAIADNKMSTLWGIPTDNIPVYGTNARVDELHSTYMDESSYPNVADLKNYYHIWGGKTGSSYSIDDARNLIIVCKSNRDDSWLAGCILYAHSDVVGNNRFSMMRDLFDALDAKRFNEEYSLDSIDCGGAYATVVPYNGNPSNYFDYDNLIDIGVNSDTINQSHSTVKLLTGLVALDKLDLDEIIAFTNDDPYGGTSGMPYEGGDKLYCVDAIKSMMITSSSIATRALARYVGNKVLFINGGAKLYSFRLANKTAYGVGVQSWIEWLNTPDYWVWNKKTGIEVTCISAENKVFIDGVEKSFTGADIITPNGIY